MKTKNNLSAQIKATRNELNAKKDKYYSDIKTFIDMNKDERDKARDEVNALETELRELEEQQKLNAINEKHAKRRAILKDLLKVEFPQEDILNDDLTFHASRVKKYPDVVKLLEKYRYLRFESHYYNDAPTYFKVNVNGNSYLLKQSIHENSKTTYRDYKTIVEACENNGILSKSISFKKFKANQKRLEKASAKIEQAIDKHNEFMDKNDFYFYEKENLISSQRSGYNYVKTIYKTLPEFKKY